MTQNNKFINLIIKFIKEELLKSDCKIGIDNLGNIHHFDIKEEVKYAERNIIKIKFKIWRLNPN